jgi:hypothetical protein
VRCAAARSHSLAPEGRLVDGNTHKMALDIEASPCAQTGDLCAPVWAGGRRGAVDARVHTRHHRQMEWAKGWPLHCAALEEARACGGNAGHCKAPRERGGLQCGRVPHPAPRGTGRARLTPHSPQRRWEDSTGTKVGVPRGEGARRLDPKGGCEQRRERLSSACVRDARKIVVDACMHGGVSRGGDQPHPHLEVTWR